MSIRCHIPHELSGSALEIRTAYMHVQFMRTYKRHDHSKFCNDINEVMKNRFSNKSIFMTNLTSYYSCIYKAVEIVKVLKVVQEYINSLHSIT